MSLVRRAVIGAAAGTIGFAVVSGLLVAQRSYRRWGATDDELREALPGDAAVTDPMVDHTHAITIAAAPEDVWPWLAQLGTGRGGWYSYEWVEARMGLDVKNVDRIVPELQHLREGDVIPMAPGLGFPVKRVEPPHLLLLEGHDAKNGDATWLFVLRETDDGSTRLISRARTRWPVRGASRALMGILEPGIFAMERKMLLEVKHRAEKLALERLPAVAVPANGELAGVR